MFVVVDRLEINLSNVFTLVSFIDNIYSSNAKAECKLSLDKGITKSWNSLVGRRNEGSIAKQIWKLSFMNCLNCFLIL